MDASKTNLFARLKTQNNSIQAETKKEEEQEAPVKLLALFRKTLIDENRLLCELRDRGAECISGNVSYSSDNQNFFRDLKGNVEYNSDDGGWEEIIKQGGLNSNVVSLVGDCEGYRVVKNEYNDITTRFSPDAFVELEERYTNPHEFALRFVPSEGYLYNWEKQSTKEAIVGELGI